VKTGVIAIAVLLVDVAIGGCMDKFLAILSNINNYYRRHLYWALPSVMAALNIGDIFLMSSEPYYITLPFLFPSAVIARYAYLYIRSGKSDLFCMCGNITLTYCLLYIFIVKRARESVLAGVGLGAIVIVLLTVTGIVKATSKRWK
jgi:hypothetical protein